MENRNGNYQRGSPDLTFLWAYLSVKWKTIFYPSKLISTSIKATRIIFKNNWLKK